MDKSVTFRSSAESTLSEKAAKIGLDGVFADLEKFSLDSLLVYYRTKGEDLSLDDVTKRIPKLIKLGVIERIGKQQYRIPVSKPSFSHNIEHPALINIAHYLDADWGHIESCVWQTNLLATLMVQQPTFNFGLVEVPADTFDTLSDQLTRQFGGQDIEIIWWNHEQKSIRQLDRARAIVEAKEFKVLPVFIKTLISNAPTQKNNGISVPTIEKILVDLFCETELFITYQGHELKNIIKEAATRFNINPVKLANYANARNQKDGFMTLFNQLKG